jgi:hypothetical protein
LTLRHQLNVLRRKSPQRLAFSSIDRLVFAGLYRLAPGVLDALKIVKPETVTSTGIRGKIDGIGFTADLAMSTQANRQSVMIDPTGATDISQVAITLRGNW